LRCHLIASLLWENFVFEVELKSIIYWSFILQWRLTFYRVLNVQYCRGQICWWKLAIESSIPFLPIVAIVLWYGTPTQNPELDLAFPKLLIAWLFPFAGLNFRILIHYVRNSWKVVGKPVQLVLLNGVVGSDSTCVTFNSILSISSFWLRLLIINLKWFFW
jgi:hypothetical protein